MPEHTLGESRYLTLADGRKLHYRTAGAGGPTVVIEGGMGFSSAIWGFVQPHVAAATHTVVYDRAGAGKSDFDHADRTLDRICDDLGQLLHVLPQPFILVGYSWGGPIVRRMALRQQFDIRALVLVNQTDERNPKYVELARRRSKILKVLTLWFMHTKGLRKASWNVIRHMPPDCRREIIFRDVLVRGAKLFAAEGKKFLSGLMLMRAEGEDVDSIDVTVIAGADPDVLVKANASGMVGAQRETATASKHGRLVLAPNSAHFAPLTEPGLVAEEILKLVEKHRTPG